MFEVYSFRETKVYQEAFEEGFEMGLQEARKKGLQVGIEEERERLLQLIPKFAALGLSALEIIEVFKLELAVVNNALGRKAD